MYTKNRSRFAAGPLAAVVVLAAALLTPPTAVSQVPFEEAEFSGYATGTAVHAEVLDSDLGRLIAAETAFSGAGMDSTGLQETSNEMGRTVTSPPEDDPFDPPPDDENGENEEEEEFEAQQLTDGPASQGRGVGVRVGVIEPAPGPLSLLGAEEATAPPSTELQTSPTATGTLLDPLAFAVAAQGVAQALWEPNICVLGAAAGLGEGRVAGADVVNLGDDFDPDRGFDEAALSVGADEPDRRGVDSRSRTMLVPQRSATGQLLGPNFGVMSETRQTLAPVTLGKGTANELTIEIGGEWVLQAVATGEPDGAYVHYGPAEDSPEAHVIRVFLNGVELDSLTFQDVADDDGLTINLPPPDGGVLEVRLANEPRAIGGDTGDPPLIEADGTAAAAAVDVLRVTALQDVVPGLTTDAELRVGHMEVAAEVPQGGIECPLPLAKTADPDLVDVGEDFVHTIPVHNPFDCVLEEVVVSDEIFTEGGARFSVIETDPPADVVTPGEGLDEGEVTWTDLGPLDPGETIELQITLLAEGAPGFVHDQAFVEALMGECEQDMVVGDVDLSPEGSLLLGASEVVTVQVGEPAPPFPVVKVSGADSVEVGESFTTVITVQNAFECVMQDVEVVDDIVTEDEARFTVAETDPQADTVDSSIDEDGQQVAVVTWNDIGPIAPGGEASVSVAVTADAGPGFIADIATVTATLAECEGEDEGRDDEVVQGQSAVVDVEVTTDEEPPLPPVEELLVTKASDVPSVVVGQDFTTTITVGNPFDCVLTDVEIVDEVTTEGAARFAFIGTNPPAFTTTTGDPPMGFAVWTGQGPVPPGGNLSVAVTLRALGGAGTIRDTARATGVLTECEGEDEGLSGVQVAGVSAVHAIPVAPDAVAPRAVDDRRLPITGAMVLTTLLGGLTLLMAARGGWAVRRRLR